MSKFEIIQQNGYEREAGENKKLNQERYTYKVKEKMRQAICFDGASLIADIAVTGMILYVGW
jgi:hypothetical protein